jgi:AraC-like DNA-binding protein
LFSDIENVSIEKYFILLKIEKSKEYLEKGQFNISEIAFKLGYSSPAHLANQFKQITDMTPTQYKNLVQSNFTNN